MQRNAGSSLVKKLGFPRGAEIAIVGPPDDFAETLGDIPDGCRLQAKVTAASRLVIWFVRSRNELEAAVEHLSVRLPDGASTWIARSRARPFTSRLQV